MPSSFNQLYAFSWDASGVLSRTAAYSTPGGDVQPIVDQTGNWVYTLDNVGFTQFSIDQKTGALSPVATVFDRPLGPIGVLVTGGSSQTFNTASSAGPFVNQDSPLAGSGNPSQDVYSTIRSPIEFYGNAAMQKQTRRYIVGGSCKPGTATLKHIAFDAIGNGGEYVASANQSMPFQTDQPNLDVGSPADLVASAWELTAANMRLQCVDVWYRVNRYGARKLS